MTAICRIGCAGWGLPKDLRQGDPSLSYLEQYARLFDCVEINSSFYKHHQPKTYARWRESVPKDFRFSVKIPKTVSHNEHLSSEEREKIVARFLDEVQQLSDKLGPLLIQFPPKRSFAADADRDLFRNFREAFRGALVCEPRHPSWFTSEAINLMEEFSIGLVGADPKPVSTAPDVLQDQKIHYYRLHGAPRIYYSDYSPEFLCQMQQLDSLRSADTWVIFDNTALGHAYRNALTLAGQIAV